MHVFRLKAVLFCFLTWMYVADVFSLAVLKSCRPRNYIKGKQCIHFIIISKDNATALISSFLFDENKV